ncbi:MAG TPA: hypothetical protein VL172_03515 [Kofleriaceae bacterium]|nr:hypothetical protein [Kofleriaceae bacterium]
MNLAELEPRMPGPSWEGWFFIAIGRRGNAVRFAKWHLFRAGPGRGHPIAAFEGLRGPAELCTFVGSADRVIHHCEAIAPEAIEARRGALAVVVPGRLRLHADGDRVRLRFDDPAAGLAADLGCRPRDRLEWARWGGLLNYVGFPGGLDGRLTALGGDHVLSGIAMAEHAWGGNLPIDPQRLRVPWTWDVLAFDGDGDGEPPVAAALAVALPGTRRAVRMRGTLPGGAPARFDRHRVDYTAIDGDTPRQWRGRMSGPAGELDYQATAATPAAGAFPDGAFLGFDFTGRWRGPAGERLVSGAGFAEHRLPANRSR